MPKWDEETWTYKSARGRPKKPGPKKSGKAKEEHVPGRGRGPGVKAQEKKANLAAFLAAGVSKDDALTMAGYSPKSEVYRDARIKESVQQMRERLQQTKGYTLVDSAEFYKKMADDSEVKPETRIKARAHLDKVAGNEATKKVEVSETRNELSVAIKILDRFQMPMSELKKLIANTEAVESGDILTQAECDGIVESCAVDKANIGWSHKVKTLEGADVVAAPIG